jgi:hypothetical protein
MERLVPGGSQPLEDLPEVALVQHRLRGNEVLASLDRDFVKRRCHQGTPGGKVLEVIDFFREVRQCSAEEVPDHLRVEDTPLRADGGKGARR